MSEDLKLELIGDKEILAAFRELDYKTQHRRLHSVLNNAANIPAKAARRVIPVRTEKLYPPSSASRARRRKAGKLNKWHPPGLGKKSIMKKKGKSISVPTVFVGPRVGTGSYKTDAYYLKIWDLYSPGRRTIISALEASMVSAQQDIYKSMRTIIQRAWNSKVKK